MTFERHYHLPGSVPCPEGMSPATARLLETAVREALRAAVRRSSADDASPLAVPPDPRERYTDDRAREGGYWIPSYDGSGRPVTVRVTGPGTPATGRPAGGLGPGSHSGSGARNLGGGAGRSRPATAGAAAAHPAAAAPAREWTEVSLATLRVRMGHGYEHTPLGRISADSLLIGGTSVRLVPALGGTDADRTLAARLGGGAFYLDPIARERVGLVAAAVPGAGYAIQRVGDDGRRQDTGLRVITWDTATVPAGILAYTSDLTTLREIRIVGSKPGDPKAAAARIAAALKDGLAMAPASVIATTLKAHLRGLGDDEIMVALEELRRLGRLGEALALVRVREFRQFLKEHGVPWSYVFANWEPDVADGAAVFSGVLWGAGENLYQVLELVTVLAGSLFSEKLAQERHQFWTAIVAFVQHPLVTGEQGLRLLRDTFLEKVEQLEFFDAGRIIGQIAMTLLTLPKAIASVPKLAASTARLAVTITRVGVAVLDRIGLRLAEVVKFLLAERHAFATPNGVILMMSGDDILLSGSQVKGTAALAHSEVVKALETGSAVFTEAEVEEWAEALTEVEKKAPKAAGRAGGTAAQAAVVTVEALEDLVARAIAELGQAPGSAGLTASVEGTKLHTIFSRLVTQRYAGVGGITVVSERSIRSFAKLPAAVLDMTVEAFVAENLAETTKDLRPFFKVSGSGKPRLIGDLRPDLVVRAPGQLVVFDLTSVERQQHMAKNLLYRSVLGKGGERAWIGESYTRHFGKTAAEIESLYPKEVRAAEIQRAAARRIKERHAQAKKP